MDKIDWLPYIKASIERNPVCFTDLKGKTAAEVYNILKIMPDDSIYDHKRLALPDEVWNFRRGDGIEKALLLADFLIDMDRASTVSIKIENKKADLNYMGNVYHFTSHKSFKKSIRISYKKYTIEELV
jgi:YHS domain-containing protein